MNFLTTTKELIGRIARFHHELRRRKSEIMLYHLGGHLGLSNVYVEAATIEVTVRQIVDPAITRIAGVQLCPDIRDEFSWINEADI